MVLEGRSCEPQIIAAVNQALGTDEIGLLILDADTGVKRDLDCYGHVSAAEWLRGGIDFRLRPSSLVAGCQDIYAVKSGAPVVVRCPEPPVCRIARDLMK